MSTNNRKFILNQIIWLGISLGISIVISMILPFTISLVAIIAIFILLNVYIRRIMMRRMCAGRSIGTGLFGFGSGGSSLKYYCINCGTQHNQAACPKCGSKMKRVGS
ncbi:MAG: hypothetical protein M3P08_15735 [Thermoproteota archaeon]|nr:hypothetical protein [Thermoproteota archaeon]